MAWQRNKKSMSQLSSVNFWNGSRCKIWYAGNKEEGVLKSSNFLCVILTVFLFYAIIFLNDNVRKLKVSYPPICENGEQGWASGDIAEFFCGLLMLIFLLLRGGKMFKFSSYLGSFEPKFPAVFFFAGIRACANMHFRSNTSVGNADRSRVCGSFFYDVVLRKTSRVLLWRG